MRCHCRRCCRFIPRLRCAHLLNIAGVIVAYGVTFGLLLPTVLHDWPYSPFYITSQDDIDIVRRVVWVCLCCQYVVFFITLYPVYQYLSSYTIIKNGQSNLLLICTSTRQLFSANLWSHDQTSVIGLCSPYQPPLLWAKSITVTAF